MQSLSQSNLDWFKNSIYYCWLSLSSIGIIIIVSVKKYRFECAEMHDYESF